MFHATTIVAVRKGNQTAIAGDGQVTMGQHTVMKHHANKIKKLHDGNVIVGFAGAVADAFTLFAKFEEKIKQANGNLTKAAVDVAREWRTDRILRNLEALLLVADREKMFVISGTGEVIEPDDGIAAIGSGGSYAMAAARALSRHTEMSAVDIVREALLIASEICIYTNDQITVQVVE
ncbi:MAG: ATP-dependent protease subunit HslV [Syntrophomonadaceae bacterium]|jgi:ATP-dependent HslUV protease subunit HslV|nr:ATP-dependent protease subunit HslV [Bacillota bacterium]NLM88459.1 ATP-dependent protease subunit HslV [Syntrophomonadaceae bacterium]HAA08647.1 HslU--HslV peptidase proteolytic subunit [Syntrophomonas sp.]HQA49090.1 ATP-dependent protease subunit HslV [Syntrophomonadaceae bacterium]HQD89462.1 ATP-dependent protease subunit HslV [Syntrophomonadaceae bacterium]